MKKNKKGFTLVEILLSLAILSVIIVGLYSTFSTGFRLNRRSETISKVFREARLSFDQLAKDLENAKYFNFITLADGLGSLKGDSNELTILVGDGSGLRGYRYFMDDPNFALASEEEVEADALLEEEDVEGIDTESGSSTFTVDERLRALYREEMTFADYLGSFSQEGSEFDSSSSPEILSTHLTEEGLTFSYGHMQEDELQWEDQWEEAYLPHFVRVELVLLDLNQENREIKLVRDILVPMGGPREGEEDGGGSGSSGTGSTGGTGSSGSLDRIPPPPPPPPGPDAPSLPGGPGAPGVPSLPGSP